MAGGESIDEWPGTQTIRSAYSIDLSSTYMTRTFQVVHFHFSRSNEFFFFTTLEFRLERLTTFTGSATLPRLYRRGNLKYQTYNDDAMQKKTLSSLNYNKSRIFFQFAFLWLWTRMYIAWVCTGSRKCYMTQRNSFTLSPDQQDPKDDRRGPGTHDGNDFDT